VPIVLERAKIKLFTEREFREFFLWGGGNFAFSKREFPVALLSMIVKCGWSGFRVSVAI